MPAVRSRALSCCLPRRPACGAVWSRNCAADTRSPQTASGPGGRLGEAQGRPCLHLQAPRPPGPVTSPHTARGSSSSRGLVSDCCRLHGDSHTAALCRESQAVVPSRALDVQRRRPLGARGAPAPRWGEAGGLGRGSGPPARPGRAQGWPRAPQRLAGPRSPGALAAGGGGEGGRGRHFPPTQVPADRCARGISVTGRRWPCSENLCSLRISVLSGDCHV